VSVPKTRPTHVKEALSIAPLITDLADEILALRDSAAVTA